MITKRDLDYEWSEEKIEIDKHKKRSGPREQGIVKTQLEVMEVENSSLCTHIWSLHCALTVKWPRLKYKKMDSTTSKTRGPGWGTAQKMVTDDPLFHLFTTFAPLPHFLKINRLRKIHISTWTSSLSEGNFSPSWINTHGNLYWTLCLTLQHDLQWSLILSILIQNLTLWFHLFWFLYINKKKSIEVEKRETYIN